MPLFVYNYGCKKPCVTYTQTPMLTVTSISHSALANGPWTWQSTQFNNVNNPDLGYTPYYRFCDYIENVWPSESRTYPSETTKVPGPEGVGVDKAIDGYAKWFTEYMLPGCKCSRRF